MLDLDDQPRLERIVERGLTGDQGVEDTSECPHILLGVRAARRRHGEELGSCVRQRARDVPRPRLGAGHRGPGREGSLVFARAHGGQRSPADE
jgi:hypothetical protein